VSDPSSLPGGLEPAREEPLGGGDVAAVRRAWLRDGRQVVVKRTPYDARLEAEGLRALADAGAVTPEVLAVDERTLVLEHLSPAPDWEAVGRELAAVHATTGASFGWHRDNVIGPLPQDNTPEDDWPTFYVEHRIRPRTRLPALPTDLRRRLDAASDGPLQALLDHDAVPSLVHGDLWSGNVVAGRALIDPAVHRADRELDLAFATLFGGIPEAMVRAYESAWPLDEGWERRRPALQLHHLLVHVELFGASYVGAITERLDRLGW
jgi:fructosamine-3-kinase